MYWSVVKMTRFQRINSLPKFCNFWVLVTLSLSFFVDLSTAQCSAGRHQCKKGHSEIYRDEANHQTIYHCCKTNSPSAAHAAEKANGCSTTKCVPISASGGDLCSSIGTRTIKSSGKKLEFVEAIRDDCTMQNGRSGVEALCCGKNTLDLTLTTLIGVEPHEFPHFARLEAKNGDKTDICGASLYNERHAITASHCVVDKSTFGPKPTDKLSIFLDIAIAGKNTDNKYGIEEVLIHPNASLLKKKGTPPLNYDIAILKLDRDIQFSDKIQALPLAPKGFKPIDFDDTVVIVGFGNTDTLTTSKKLQKADSYIRDPNVNTGRRSRYPQHKKDVDQLLFLGGYQNGIPSPSASSGDSGGPAVCRDKSGNAVLCGLTSFGPNNKDKCLKFKSENECFPTAYVKIDYFRDWIVETAGGQENAMVMKQPLYGRTVGTNKHPHQVEIVSGNKNDHNCGGTLLSRDVVLTAAHCVANDDGKMKSGLMVSRTGKKATQEVEVKSIKVLEGFGKNSQKKNDRPRRIAVFATKPTWDAPYYKNDLALVKLEEGMNVPKDRLPKIANTEAIPGPATEIAWVTDYRRKGKLAERKFNLMTHAECQQRMDRLTYTGLDIKVDGNIVCGVEEYSGGSKCDRTLGGGVLCGGNTLCGVQAFRLCEFSVPNAFVDVGLNSDWIQKNMKNL